MPYPLADLFAWQRQYFVDHNLRYPTEAVLPTRIESYPKKWRVYDRAGQRHDGNTGVNIVEDIRLNN